MEMSDNDTNLITQLCSNSGIPSETESEEETSIGMYPSVSATARVTESRRCSESSINDGNTLSKRKQYQAAFYSSNHSSDKGTDPLVICTYFVLGRRSECALCPFPCRQPDLSNVNDSVSEGCNHQSSPGGGGGGGGGPRAISSSS